MARPFRWTKLRKNIRYLLENGYDPAELKRMLRESYEANHPTARPAVRAATAVHYNNEVDEVAKRIGSTT